MGEQFPKCRFCGEHHRNGPQWCPALKSSGGDEAKRAPAKPRREVAGNSPSRVKPAVVASSPPEAKPKKKRAPNGTFDRKAYQRELMRKRRQEEARRKKEQEK